MLGDSSFKVSSIMIPAFKKPFRSDLGREESVFNSMLAKIRIRSEHCIGLLKAIFQYLKRIRTLVKDKNSMKWTNRYILAAAVLHNLMIKQPCPDDWYVQEEPDTLGDDEELNKVSATPNSDERRKQLFAYLIQNKY